MDAIDQKKNIEVIRWEPEVNLNYMTIPLHFLTDNF